MFCIQKSYEAFNYVGVFWGQIRMSGTFDNDQESTIICLKKGMTTKIVNDNMKTSTLVD